MIDSTVHSGAKLIWTIIFTESCRHYPRPPTGTLHLDHTGGLSSSRLILLPGKICDCTSSCDQAVVYVCYTSIDIVLPLYFSFVFLFHCYFCCILLPYGVNKDFKIALRGRKKRQSSRQTPDGEHECVDWSKIIVEWFLYDADRVVDDLWRSTVQHTYGCTWLASTWL